MNLTAHDPPFRINAVDEYKNTFGMHTLTVYSKKINAAGIISFNTGKIENGGVFMDNKDNKKNEKNEKRQFKLNKAKTAEFLKRNGFYIALFICIVAAGLTAIFSLAGPAPEPKLSAQSPDGQQVEKINDPSLSDEISKLSESPSPTVSPSPTPSVTPSASPTSSANKKPESNKPAFYLEAPVKGKIIRAFMIDKLTYNKTLNQWSTHNGIDIQADEGTEVKAAMSGTVEAAYSDPVFGGVIILKHDNNRKTVYAGITADSKIEEGTKVNTSQTLGVLKTPNFEAYLGPHLHFELIEGTNNLDPAKYFR